MTGINVHRHIRQVELLKRVLDTLVIRCLRISALGYVEIRHHVGETVRLDDEQGADVAKSGELHLDCVDVGLVVGNTVVGNAVLAIGGCRGTVTVREIVDNEQSCVRRRGARCVGGADVAEGLGHQGGHLGSGVAGGRSACVMSISKPGASWGYIQPLERGDLGDLSSLRGLCRGEGRDRIGGDLGGIVRVGPLLHAREGVAAVASGRGGAARGASGCGRGRVACA